jgi:mycoredoxin
MPSADPSSTPTITVYWRPGCGFCAGLQRGLDRAGVAYDRVDIWQDEAGAAFVRAHNGGNELVPTVDVGGTVLSNPSVAQVVAAAGLG